MSRHVYKMDLGKELSEGQTHLDSHADTCVCGANFVMLEREDQVVEFADVSPFLDDYEPIKDIPIASCATTWVDPENGQPHVLVLQSNARFYEVTADIPWDPYSKKSEEDERSTRSRLSETASSPTGGNSQREIKASYLQEPSRSRKLSATPLA